MGCFGFPVSPELVSEPVESIVRQLLLIADVARFIFLTFRIWWLHIP